MTSSVQERLGNPEEEFNHEKEELPVVDYESYRLLCDVIDDFRKVGIQDKDAFEAAIRDARTTFVDYGGLRIPFLTPLEYEKMYNEARTCALAGKEKAMLLAVPFAHISQMDLEDSLIIEDDTVVVVEEFVSTDGVYPLDQHDVSDLPFRRVEAIDFKNQALSASPSHETAWMAAYVFIAESREGQSRPYDGQPLVGEIMEKYREYCVEKGRPDVPDEHSSGTFQLSAEQLANRPDIVAQLWDVSQIGFGEILGEGHPVSMEFNEEFFFKKIADKNSMTLVEYVDGQIDCFGFLGLDLDNDWINGGSTAIEGVLEEAKASGRAVVHVHELIGRGKRGMGHARKLLNTFFDVVSETGYPYSVFFESTNMSSLYIPPLITKSLERSKTMTMTSDIKTLGKLSYWGLVAERRPEDFELVK
jgi:hypothetical protein